MQTENIVQQMQSEWERKGARKGERKGLQKGKQETLLAVYRARFGAVPRKVRAAVEHTQDSALLTRWAELFATGSTDAITAALPTTKR